MNRRSRRWRQLVRGPRGREHVPFRRRIWRSWRIFERSRWRTSRCSWRRRFSLWWRRRKLRRCMRLEESDRIMKEKVKPSPRSQRLRSDRRISDHQRRRLRLLKTSWSRRVIRKRGNSLSPTWRRRYQGWVYKAFRAALVAFLAPEEGHW